MTLSGSMAPGTPGAAPRRPKRPGPLRRLGAALARIEDGDILRVAFFAILIGTAAVLTLDYLDLQSQEVPQYDPTEAPVLPAVFRPEIDPDNPAFSPLERILTDPAILAEPLDVALVGGGVLRLRGAIDPGAVERVEAELAERGEYVTTVSLDSPGGSVEDALAISRLIREGGFSTEVGPGALCASSCPLVMAGGETRIASARAVIGVHQIYTFGMPAEAASQAMSDAQVTTAAITRHLDAMGVVPAMWLHALETPPDRLYYFTPEELEEFALATEILADAEPEPETADEPQPELPEAGEEAEPAAAG